MLQRVIESLNNHPLEQLMTQMKDAPEATREKKNLRIKWNYAPYLITHAAHQKNKWLKLLYLDLF